MLRWRRKSMAENKSFTDKLIARAQRLAATDPFVPVAREYLTRHDRLITDYARGLFWVVPSFRPAQVATFMPLF